MSRIDVIVPCYRYGRFLTSCVESILSQRGVDVRVLILDDASPDETETVGRALERADRRVEYRRHASNVGHVVTFNEGLAWATGDYVLILSADDALTPGALARITRVMDAHPEVTLGYGRDVRFNSDLLPRHAGAADIHARSEVIEYRRFLEVSCNLGHTPMQSPTVVVRNEVQQRVGGFAADYPHGADTELWLRLAMHGRVAFVDADQAFRRVHPASLSFKYSLLERLEEQRRGFDVHLDRDCPLPDAASFRSRVHATLATQAFWLGAHAFDQGNIQTCEACLDFALDTDPSIRSSRSWRRLAVKRRLGARAWGWLRPLSGLVPRGA
jgi:glycosyltransferase involved in cell wall biosynthesis